MRFLTTVYYANTAAAWLIAVAVLVGGLLLLALVRRLLVRRLERFAVHTGTQLDDLFLELLRRTRYFFLCFLALEAATASLVLAAPVDAAIRALTAVAVLLQLAIWGNAAVTFWLGRAARASAGTDHKSVKTISALGVLARLAVWLVVALTALDHFGVNVRTLITGLGIAGVAVALAVQSILGDLLASLSIVFDKPFVIGDYIVVDTYQGTVEDVGLKTTRIRSLSGEQIIFANGELLKARIRNFKRMVERRAVFSVGLAYSTTPAQIEAVPAMIREIVTAIPQVRLDRTHFASFGESSLNVETVYYVESPDYVLYMDVQQRINLELMRRIAAAGISFASPTRTLVVTRGDLVDPAARRDPVGAGPATPPTSS